MSEGPTIEAQASEVKGFESEMRRINTPLYDESVERLLTSSVGDRGMRELDMKTRDIMDLVRVTDALRGLREFRGVIHTEYSTTRGGGDSGGLSGPGTNSHQEHMLRIECHDMPVDFPLAEESVAKIEEDHSRMVEICTILLLHEVETALPSQISRLEEDLANPLRYADDQRDPLKKEKLDQARETVKAYKTLLPIIEKEMAGKRERWNEEEQEFIIIYDYISLRVFPPNSGWLVGGSDQGRFLRIDRAPVWLDPKDHIVQEYFDQFDAVRKNCVGIGRNNDSPSKGYTPNNLQTLIRIKEMYEQLGRKNDPYFGMTRQEIKERVKLERKNRR